MNKALKIGAVLAFVQGALLLGYLAASRARAPSSVFAEDLALPVTVERGLPLIPLRDRGGIESELVFGSRPVLLHLWATWCQPCREELPALLALDGREFRVVAVALDPQWSSLEDYFDGEIPPQVALGNSSVVEKSLGVRSLPVTFLFQPEQSSSLVFEGARAWQDEEWRSQWWPRGD